MYVENHTKIADFPTLRVFNAPADGVPLGICIGVRSPECFYDGAIRGSKKVSDRFSRFDTIPAVTDTQPPTQPATLS